MQLTIEQQKQELVDCIHFLHAQGWAPATSSNYSFRDSGERYFYISSSGKDKGAFVEEDLMRVDLQGRPLEEGRRPSAETLLHVEIYKHCPDATCVLHTHTVYNTVVSHLRRAQKLLRLEGFEILKGLQGIRTHETFVDLPIFENSQDMPALAEEVSDYLESTPAAYGFLLAAHGMYTWGKSIAEAKRHVEVLEFLFECYYKIQLVERN